MASSRDAVGIVIPGKVCLCCGPQPHCRTVEAESAWHGWIEKRANAAGAEAGVKKLPMDEARSKGLVKDLDAKKDYLARLEKLIDFDAIKTLKLAYDPLYGAGRGWLDAALKKNGVAVEVLHDTRDPNFGGTSPDPSDSRLGELRTVMKSSGGP